MHTSCITIVAGVLRGGVRSSRIITRQLLALPQGCMCLIYGLVTGAETFFNIEFMAIRTAITTCMKSWLSQDYGGEVGFAIVHEVAKI